MTNDIASGLTSVRKLVITNNELRAVPEWVLHLESLEEVGLTYENDIKDDDPVLAALKAIGVSVSKY